MEKILKKYTTIPQHLYVNRNADKQLKTIVEEMQRPGYVLVARQMGKTNLLINAKRTLEDDNRIFSYVDMSNFFKHERDCYKNIIDIILESHEELFESISLKVYNLRKNKYPPHKEYSMSLRIILKHFSGDIVIILDEIDALRNAEYSDNIFAQIRSNYFSRTNFKELERLTYILSGVIEPIELIKDKNKSPFNIGDKIYLDDFTIEEHNDFISKSKLSINKSISKEIYNWTNGNPRLTFDICSDIEDEIIDDKIITKISLSKLIKKKYLTSFDIAPVDHIRELVKSNIDIRKAVLNLQQNINSFSDELKKKLYLFGIIDSQFNKVTQIKNRIIKESLSISWVDTINESYKNITFRQAMLLYDAKDYKESINTCELLLNLSKPSGMMLEKIKHLLGSNHYSLRNHKEALKNLSFNFSNMDLKRRALFMSGFCKFNLNDSIGGNNDFLKLIKNKTYDSRYQIALHTLAINSFKTDKEKSFWFFSELYDSTMKTEMRSNNKLLEEQVKLRLSCLFHKGIIKIEENDITEALALLHNALEVAKSSDSLYIEYIINSISDDKDHSFNSKIIDTIINNKLNFSNQDQYVTTFNESHLIKYLAYLFDKNDNTLFEKLIKYSIENIYNNNEEHKNHLIYGSSKISNKRIDILKYLLDNNISNPDLLLKIYYDLSLLKYNDDTLFFKYFDHYKKHINRISVEVIYLYNSALRKFYEMRKPDKGISLCNEIIPRINSSNEADLKPESIRLYRWLTFLYRQNNDFINTRKTAKLTLQLINSTKKGNSPTFDEKKMKSIKDDLNRKLKHSNSFKKRKIGRNEKIKVNYNDGVIIGDKYKRLKNDIKSGKCKIINDQNALQTKH